MSVDGLFSRDFAVSGSRMTRRYKAFISYSQRDAKWARWLQGRLEGFRPPSGMAGSRHPLRPVFLDRDELASAGRLDQALIDALDDSEHLIVICSSHSASSRWVDAEVRHFLSANDRAQVLTLIVEDTDQPVFPKGLLELGGEPLAADLTKDGRRNALLKIAAGLLSVRFDDLRRRHDRQHQNRLLAVTASSALAVIVMAFLTVFAFRERAAAEAARDEAEQVADFLVQILREANPENRPPSEVSIRDVLDRGYARAQAALQDNPEVRARILATIANAYASIGLYERTLEIRHEIVELWEGVDGTDPMALPGARANLASALSSLGGPQNNAQALEIYDQALAEMLALRDPDRDRLAAAWNGVGSIQMFMPGFEERSVESFRNAVSALKGLEPPNLTRLAWAYQNMGYPLIQLGRLEEARDVLEHAMDIALENARDNHVLRSTIGLNLGDALIQSGELDRAETVLADVRDDLVSVLGESHARVATTTRLLGSVAHLKGNAAKAAELYRETIRIAETLEGASNYRIKAYATVYLGDLALAQEQTDKATAFWLDALAGWDGPEAPPQPHDGDPRAALEALGAIRLSLRQP